MRAARLYAAELARWSPDQLGGAVLLAAVRLPGGMLQKGLRLDPTAACSIITAARAAELPAPIRVAWPEAGDLHEDAAAATLANAAAGEGVDLRAPRQSRLDLAARWDGVLHVRAETLGRLNTIDPLEVFTLFHGQAVRAGDVVASVKVAPHLVSEARVAEGVRIALEHGPIVSVRPYRPQQVAAIAAEPMTEEERARFEKSVRTKIESLRSTFAGTTAVSDGDPAQAESQARAALEHLILKERVPLVLVGGVSSGDPLSPFFVALEGAGGRVTRRGVPAHPGSMIWLAELAESQLLGLPQCGMFSFATAADLILPRLLTGERLTAESIAELGHGGLLTRDMRFRFPAYARELEAPEG